MGVCLPLRNIEIQAITVSRECLYSSLCLQLDKAYLVGRMRVRQASEQWDDICWKMCLPLTGEHKRCIDNERDGDGRVHSQRHGRQDGGRKQSSELRESLLEITSSGAFATRCIIKAFQRTK